MGCIFTTATQPSTAAPRDMYETIYRSGSKYSLNNTATAQTNDNDLESKSDESGAAVQYFLVTHCLVTFL